MFNAAGSDRMTRRAATCLTWVAALVLSLVCLASEAAAQAQCAVANGAAHPDKTVVLLSYPEDLPQGGQPKRMSGVLVSDTGLILTLYDLIRNELDPATLLSTHQDRLRLLVSAGTLESTEPGIVIGHDWRRNLLLVKVSESFVSKNKLSAAQLKSLSGQPTEDVCLVGFREFNRDTGEYRPHVSEIAGTRPSSDVFLTAETGVFETDKGGGVISSRDSSLVGLIQGGSGNETEFLPIEFTDTLLSQVFLARIMSDLDVVLKRSDELITGINWDYRVLDGDMEGEADALKIRFYFDQHIDELRFDKVQVSTRLWGTDPQGENDTTVPTTNSRDWNDRLSVEENYIDYELYSYLDLARDAGFTSLSRLRITLQPQFEKSKRRKQSKKVERKTIYNFPLEVELVQ